MRKDRSVALLFVLVVVGALLGSVLGEALAGNLPILARTIDVGIEPTTVNLFVLTLTLGASLKLNLASAIGIILALLLFRRA